MIFVSICIEYNRIFGVCFYIAILYVFLFSFLINQIIFIMHYVFLYFYFRILNLLFFIYIRFCLLYIAHNFSIVWMWLLVIKLLIYFIVMCVLYQSWKILIFLLDFFFIVPHFSDLLHLFSCFGIYVFICLWCQW